MGAGKRAVWDDRERGGKGMTWRKGGVAGVVWGVMVGWRYGEWCAFQG